MRLDEFQVICCVNCGRSDRPLRNLPTLNTSVKGCDLCIAFYGEVELAHEADQILANAAPARSEPLPCHHCGGLMLMNLDGTYNLWCQGCEKERRRIAEQGAIQ